MLCDEEDNYQDILTRSRQVAVSELYTEVNAELILDTLVALIEKGAQNVVYSKEQRIAACSDMSDLDRCELEFTKLVDRYRQIARNVGWGGAESLDVLSGYSTRIPRAQGASIPKSDLAIAKSSADALRDSIRERCERYEGRFVDTFYSHLVHAPQVLISGVRYQDYLTAGVSYLRDAP